MNYVQDPSRFQVGMMKKILKFLSFNIQNNLLILHLCVSLMAALCWGSAKVDTCPGTFLSITQKKAYQDLLKMWRFGSAKIDATDSLQLDAVSPAFHRQLKRTQNLSGFHPSCLPPDIISNSFGAYLPFSERERKTLLMCCLLEHCHPICGSHSTKDLRDHEEKISSKVQHMQLNSPGFLVVAPAKARVLAGRQHKGPTA